MMKTYDQILKPQYLNKIFAHTSSKNSETLIEHSQKTLKYCDFLMDKLALKENFTYILSQLVPVEQTPHMLELIRAIIYYHDLGKVNPIFQKEKMKHDNLKIQTKNLNTNHSFYGKILFDRLFYDDFHDKFTKKDGDNLFFLLSQTIDRHHTALRDVNLLSKKMDNSTIQKELEDLNTTSDVLFAEWKNMPATETWCRAYNCKDKSGFDIRKFFKQDGQEALFYLYKTVYSLLITSDYYATSDFYQGMSYFDKISTISPSLIDKCGRNFYKYKFNAEISNSARCKKLMNADVSDIGDLNELRAKILLEADSKLADLVSSNPKQRIFYLNVPTGGGKTNISMKLALTLLKTKKDIKRMFYVFPFINLIEQNQEVIKKTLDLDGEISPVYSSSAWSIESESKSELLQYSIDNEFLNYQFVVISNVNFFNTFVKSGKASNYRLINLANSVVIIDEIQSLDDKNWTLFNDLITYGSKYLNIYFVIMSATLPKLDALLDTDKASFACNLTDNANEYFNHPRFKNRVSIEYKNDINDTTQLIDTLKDELHDGVNKVLLVVNTVRTSLELYKKVIGCEKIRKMGFSVILLNSTLLPHRRKEIVNEMKGGNKTILVSTQSVEAGIDIDCDFGMRDYSIFDSIEQVAGRVNRNSKDQVDPARLIVVDLQIDGKPDADLVYRESYRWETMRGQDFASSELVQDFLRKRDFDYYYNKVLERIKSRDTDPIRESSLDVVKKGIRHLDFEKLNRTDIIKHDSVSVLVDVDISVVRAEFTKAELEFIEQHGKILNNVSGKQIWRLYNEFLEGFQGGHVDRKINSKIWSSILSKFTVNIRNSHDGKKLSEILDLAKGIPLLKKEYYSEEEGTDRTILKQESFYTPS